MERGALAAASRARRQPPSIAGGSQQPTATATAATRHIPMSGHMHQPARASQPASQTLSQTGPPPPPRIYKLTLLKYSVLLGVTPIPKPIQRSGMQAKTS
eukprot:COSAG01_NODE_563_length_15451_cov_70.726225_1_plen_100_part_00